MSCRLIVSFLVVLACASVFADKKWEDYPDAKYYDKDTSGCKFPFTYKGDVYHDCTIADGNNGDWPWCSHDDTYKGYFKYCYDFRNFKLECNETYSVNRKEYHLCEKWTTNAPYKKCKTKETDTQPSITINCPPALDKPKTQTDYGRIPCDPQYEELSPDHTMCYAPSDYAVVVPITDDEQTEILQMHNAYRGEVGADHMFALHWDDELAKMAEGRGKQCGFDHDLAKNRESPVYKTFNGQNMVYSTDTQSSLADMVDQMLGTEKPCFVYGQGCYNSTCNCLHYTQALISNLTRVGCSHVQCVYQTRVERFLTCNYIESQYANKYMRPYETGKGTGALCKTLNDDGTCECGNVRCDDPTKQRINPKSCQCEDITGARKKREDSEDKIMAVPAADFSTLLKRKKRLTNILRSDRKMSKDD